MEHWEIFIFFFIIALIYASVGFGGGSSYIAILATYAMPFKEMRLVALICNIIVVSGGTFIFIKHKQVNWKKILPIALVSVPLAFVGGRLKLNQDTFFIILGCSLILAAVMLWIKIERDKVSTTPTNKANYVKHGLLGGIIGFLSGMVGIGGGIFLSPVLNLTAWDTPKKIAATASIFILFNSVAGIAGQLTVMPSGLNYVRMVLLCVAVFLGGQAGSRLGAIKFDPIIIRRLTALLVFFAGGEVLIRHL